MFLTNEELLYKDANSYAPNLHSLTFVDTLSGATSDFDTAEYFIGDQLIKAPAKFSASPYSPSLHKNCFLYISMSRAIARQKIEDYC
jgi:hypothetical protein